MRKEHNGPTLSSEKEVALHNVYAESMKGTPYEVLNDRMISIGNEGDEPTQVLVLDELERSRVEQDVFFGALPQMDFELLSAYVPKDLDPDLMLKYVGLVIEDQGVDEYTTCRFIQQLIDWDTYLADMLGSVEEGKSPVSPVPVKETKVPVVVSEEVLDTLRSSPEPAIIDLGGVEVMVEYDPEEETAYRKFYLIEMEQHPMSRLQARCSDWGLTGMFLIQDNAVAKLQDAEGALYHPELQLFSAESVDDLLELIEVQAFHVIRGNPSENKTSLVCRAIEETPMENSDLTLYTLHAQVVSSPSKLIPVRTN